MGQLSLFDEQFDVLSPRDELIEKLMLRGSGVQDGKKRIHKFAMTKPTPEKFAAFLRDEYGFGGFGSPRKAPNYIDREMHDNKGICFEGTDRDGNRVKGELKWIEAAKVILRMIGKGAYP